MLVAALVGLAGCSQPPSTVPSAAPSAASVAAFPENTVVDYQLGGGYPPAPGVGGVVRDSTDVPVDGLYSVCYVNGFQSQPADRSMWLEKHPDLILTRQNGTPLIDENWPDELIFDISDSESRERLGTLLSPSIATCSSKGFDAIEFDNLDSWTRSEGKFDETDALAMAVLLVDFAHTAGLAVAQKNAPELGGRGRGEAGFDFAIAEQCHRYNECEAYTSVYGARVIDIEYIDGLASGVADVCADAGIPYSTIVRDRDLTTPGNPEYVFHNCRSAQL